MPFFFESDPDPNLDFVKKKKKNLQDSFLQIHASPNSLRKIHSSWDDVNDFTKDMWRHHNCF